MLKTLAFGLLLAGASAYTCPTQQAQDLCSAERLSTFSSVVNSATTSVGLSSDQLDAVKYWVDWRHGGASGNTAFDDTFRHALSLNGTEVGTYITNWAQSSEGMYV
eukprot:g845.t1